MLHTHSHTHTRRTVITQWSTLLRMTSYKSYKSDVKSVMSKTGNVVDVISAFLPVSYLNHERDVISSVSYLKAPTRDVISSSCLHWPQLSSSKPSLPRCDISSISCLPSTITKMRYQPSWCRQIWIFVRGSPYRASVIHLLIFEIHLV